MQQLLALFAISLNGIGSNMADALFPNVPPWRTDKLKDWSISGMNHYHVKGEKSLFVSMTLNNYTIVAEGFDEIRVWGTLEQKAAEYMQMQKAAQDFKFDLDAPISQEEYAKSALFIEQQRRIQGQDKYMNRQQEELDRVTRLFENSKRNFQNLQRELSAVKSNHDAMVMVLHRVHNALATPSRPRQSIGEMVEFLLNKEETYLKEFKRNVTFLAVTELLAAATKQEHLKAILEMIDNHVAQNVDDLVDGNSWDKLTLLVKEYKKRIDKDYPDDGKPF